MDVSSFTDDELAQIANDKSGEYSSDLSLYTSGALAHRMAISLEPYSNSVMHDGDRRGHSMTIDLLYQQMTPAVRQALGWTPETIAANDKMLDGDNQRFGAFDMGSVISNLLSAVKAGGLRWSQSAS